MAYIGRDPVYGLFEKQTFAPNGVDVSFTLDYLVGSAGSILVVQGGSVKNPEVDYTIIDGGRKINFSTAPSSAFFVLYLGKQYLVPNYGKRFVVRSLSDNLTLTSADLPDILSLEPLTATRTVFIPIATEVAGYQLVIRNRSATVSIIINAGVNVVTILPNTNATIVSDSLNWFVV
jgi:hypothetical protein